MTVRLPAILAAALVTAALATAPASAAERLGLAEARTGDFPDRAYVLTLPKARTLGPAGVTVTENGQPVSGIELSAAGQRSGIVLAIDASESMHSGAIDDAMVAARAFAERRRPKQKLGILFFSREQTVALEPTTDVTAIDRALAESPALTRGTRVYDAAARAVELLRDAEVAAGSVVVLSDGADVGSLTARNDVIAGAKDARVRLFGVGLRSPSYDSTSLRALTETGGSYVEAGSPKDLEGIYSRLGERLGREFLVTYRSTQRLESDVAVAVSVDGIADVATAAYRTPDLPIPPGVPDPPPTWWESPVAAAAAALLAALLIGLGIFLLVRPVRRTLSDRVAVFTEAAQMPEDQFEAEHVRSMFAAADRRLSKWRPWAEFKLDVELAKLSWPPGRIVLATVLATGAATAGLVLLDSYVFAFLALLGMPVASRQTVRYLATKVRRRFEDQLPDNLQVLASALRAGHSFIGALGEMTKDAPEPSRKEFRRVVRDERIGVPIEQSLAVVHQRMKCEDVIYIGLIATLQRETGGNTAEVLDKVVETMRERAKIRRLVRTLTAQGRLGGWIVTLLPIAMIVFLNVFKPNYMEPMLERTIGWVILVMAGLMVAVGAYCIRRIVDIKV